MAKRKYEKDISLSKTLLASDVDVAEVVANCNIKYEGNSVFSNFRADEGQNIRLKIPIPNSEDMPDREINSLSPRTKKGGFIVNQMEAPSCKQALIESYKEKKSATSEFMSKLIIKQEPSPEADLFTDNEQDYSQLAAECIIIVSANDNLSSDSFSSKEPTVIPRVIKKEPKCLIQSVSEVNAKSTILEDFKPGTRQLNIILEQPKVTPDNQSKTRSQEVNIQNIKSENSKAITTFSAAVPIQQLSSQNLKGIQTVDGRNVLQIKPKVLLPKATISDHVTINELSNKQGFKCTRCDNVFFSLAHIQKHMKNCCIDETPASIRYPCPKCSASFHTNGLMIRHLKSCGTQNSSKIKVPCSTCGIHFVKSYIEKHMESCGVKRNSDEVSTCGKCGVRFAGPSLLEKHKERCGQKNKPKTKLTCSSCSTSFLDKISLDKHIEECCEGGKLSALTCFNCGNLFTTKYNLKQHVANCGRESILKKTECFYPSCNKKFFHVKRMLQHIENEHKDMKMDENELTFLSIEDFKKWKEEEESRTMTFYAKEGGKQYKHGTYLYYVCQHSGTDRSHWKYPKVGFKKNKKGTVKIGMMCPARMMVKRLNSGGVSVRYISTHNHEIVFENTQHQPLSETTVRYIKQQLALGVPERKIQENLKVGFIDDDLENSVDDDLIRKKHLVTLRQIQAIGRRMNVIAQLHKEDAEAIDLLVRKLEISECNPVITYKPQGSPLVIGAVELDDLPFSEDLFALGLQTKEQLDIMRGSDTRVLCVDTTYCKKEGYAFLFSFVLPDGYGKGYPVAHFITNHRDETTLRYLFSSLKEHCPGLSIKAIMSDGSQSGVNAHKALSIVFGETKHLLCHNILNRNWKFRLRALAKGDRTLQHEIIAYLEAMMREQSEDFFQQLGLTFIEKYSSVCPRFTEYFSKTYLNKPELWAKCYRVPLDINNDSIPYCQAFNDKLRSYYKNRNLKMRIHELIVLLVSFWNDTQVESVTLDEQEISGAASDSDHYEVEPVVFQLRPPQEDQTVHGVFDDLEKLKAYFQNPNIRKEMLLNVSGTLNQWVQQCEAVIPTDSIPSDSVTVPSRESDTAVKNLIGTFQF